MGDDPTPGEPLEELKRALMAEIVEPFCVPILNGLSWRGATWGERTAAGAFLLGVLIVVVLMVLPIFGAVPDWLAT